MAKYLLTNVSDTQQVVEYGAENDLDTTVIIPAKTRIMLDIDEEKIESLKLKLSNIIVFRKL